VWFAKTLADCKINRIAAAVSPAFCYNFSHVALCQSLFRNGGSPVSRATKSPYRHDRRRILHVNVTKHPTSGWIIQQLREAFPFEAPQKYLIFDRDQKFGFEVIAAVNAKWLSKNYLHVRVSSF
jgi:hypothetical protein